jgi:hypothetical protein
MALSPRALRIHTMSFGTFEYGQERASLVLY